MNKQEAMDFLCDLPESGWTEEELKKLLEVAHFWMVQARAADVAMVPAFESAVQTQAEADVLSERRKQRGKYGADHDDAHADAELAAAGAFFALEYLPCCETPAWLVALYERHNLRERLVMASAFIVAEIDRMDRQQTYARIGAALTDPRTDT